MNEVLIFPYNKEKGTEYKEIKISFYDLN